MAAWLPEYLCLDVSLPAELFCSGCASARGTAMAVFTTSVVFDVSMLAREGMQVLAFDVLRDRQRCRTGIVYCGNAPASGDF